MRFKVVIPARHASTRLPGKPLLDIAGKPMVVHVVEQALASGAEQVVVATDHQGILQAVEASGYEAVTGKIAYVGESRVPSKPVAIMYVNHGAFELKDTVTPAP